MRYREKAPTAGHPQYVPRLHGSGVFFVYANSSIQRIVFNTLVFKHIEDPATGLSTSRLVAEATTRMGPGATFHVRYSISFFPASICSAYG